MRGSPTAAAARRGARVVAGGESVGGALERTVATEAWEDSRGEACHQRPAQTAAGTLATRAGIVRRAARPSVVRVCPVQTVVEQRLNAAQTARDAHTALDATLAVADPPSR